MYFLAIVAPFEKFAKFSEKLLQIALKFFKKLRNFATIWAIFLKYNS